MGNRSVQEIMLDRKKNFVKPEVFIDKCRHEELNFEKFYQKNKKVFEYCEYMRTRHNIALCVCAFTFGDDLAIDHEKMLEYIRLSDKLISIDSQSHVIFLLFSDITSAVLAMQRIERELSCMYHIDINDVFRANVIESKSNTNLAELTKRAIRNCDFIEYGIAVIE